MTAEGEPIPPPIPHGSDDLAGNAGTRMLLPVGRSGYAIAAGYLGFLIPILFLGPFVFGGGYFGLLYVFSVPGPLAMIFGILAIRAIRKSRVAGVPKYGMGRAVFGLIMGALATAVIVLILVSWILHSGGGN